MLSNYNQGTTIVDLNPAGFYSFTGKEMSSGLHYYFIGHKTLVQNYAL